MRILSIGSDDHIFDLNSQAYARQLAYAHEFGKLDIVVSTRRDVGIAPERALSIYSAPRICVYRTACKLPRPDIVTVQDPFELGLIALLVARHFGVPLHVQLHTDPFNSEFMRAHWPLNLIRRMLMGYILRRATRIRVVSEQVRQKIVLRYNLRTPITTLPIFVDIDRFRKIIPSPRFISRFSSFSPKLLIVARLEAEKNISLGLRAFASAAPKNACLIVVGEGTERASLEREAQELGIADRVLFEGHNDPAPYYAIANLVLVTSLYEGYGMAVIEALAAGRPVLSTDVGIAREAGAIITTGERYSEALRDWCVGGPNEARLKNYPYRDFGDYVKQYAADVAACADGSKTQ